jgi:hypothetical protein
MPPRRRKVDAEKDVRVVITLAVLEARRVQQILPFV